MRLALAACAVAALGCGDNIHFGHGGLVVSPTEELHTSEAGDTATFTVALGSEPHEAVIVTLTSMNAREGTVSPAQLVFTEATFAEPRTVTVTGVDDLRADGNAPYFVRVDAGRIGLVDVDLVNLDDDVAGFVVTPETGLMTSEAGMQASFTVRLTSQPSANVTVPVASSDAGEGMPDTSALVFTPDDWDTPQTVKVTGMPDGVADGNVAYAIDLGNAASDDLGYAGLDPDDVSLVNLDGDLRGIVVAPLTIETSESGTQASFTVVLTAAPTAAVTIGVTSSDPGEAAASTSQLVFTPGNWSTPQAVIVTGVDDGIVDGDQPYTIALAPAVGDAAYAGLDPDDVTGTNHDNDAVGIAVSPTSLTTNEAGGAATFDVVLTSQPTANVTIPIASSDLTEGTVAPAMLVFTPASWNVPQTVTVTGVDDLVTDGNQTYTIVLSPAVSSDTTYAGIDPHDVTVVNIDDDIPGFVVTPTSGLVVTEFGDTDTFTIALTTRPLANVTVTLTSSDLTEGTVQPAAVTFTPASWNVPQIVTVRGVNDNLADGNIVFTIITGAATSTDPNYAGLNPPDVQVTNIDNDIAQVFVRAKPLLRVSENGSTATFRIGLTTQPTANVTCTLHSTDATEGAVSPTNIVFTPLNWNARVVTILGLDDAIIDGPQYFQIVTDACTSADPSYNGQNPRDVNVVNLDND